MTDPKAQEIATNMARWFNDPWKMIEDRAIYTLDEVDLKTPVKLFTPDEYLKVIAEEWMREKLLAVPKSRRMRLTWLMVFLHLWLAMFHQGASVFFVSDKEEKSDFLVRRAEFIFDHLPADKMLKPQMRSKYCLLEFPGLNSSIRGIAQGAGQLRQYTATALFFDEFAFWERGRETLGASKPTVDGGGRITIVSSAQEGAFGDVVFDRMM